MATWHQQQNPQALQTLHSAEPGKWKCVSDRNGQPASCMVFDNAGDAQRYCDRTGDRLVAPPTTEHTPCKDA